MFVVPILIAVAGAAAGSAVAAATTAFIGSIVGAVVVTGLGLAANAIFSKKPSASMSVSPLADRNQQIKANVNSNVQAIPVIYGRAKVGGQLVYIETAKNDQYLFMIITVCEGEIKGFKRRIYLDGFKYTHRRFKDANVRVVTRKGTDDQSSFKGNFTNLKIPKWTTAHRLRGVSAIAVRAKFDPEVFSHPPVITSIPEGKKVYDPRDGSTGYSNNPALCIRDYLTNSRYGCGRSSSEVDDTSFQDAANYCDQSVTLNDGSTQQNRYTCNGVVDTSKTLLDNMKDLLTCCRGMLIFTGGQYRLIIDKAETATFTFNEDNIIGGISIHQLGKREKKNRIEATFIDPRKKYEPNIAVVKNTTYLSEDNETVLSENIDLPFTNSYSRAAQIAKMALQQSRQKFVIKFKATIKALQVEPAEVVYVTHSTPGWSNKLFRVVHIELDQNDEVAIEAVEYDSDVYDLSTVVDEDPSEDDFNTTSIPNIYANSATVGFLQHGGTSGSHALSSAARWHANAFIAPANTTLSKVQIYVQSVSGSLGSNDLTCELQADSSGKPSGTSLQTVNTVTSGPSAGAFLEYTGFSYSLSKGTRYWLVQKNVNGTPASNNITIRSRSGATYTQFINGGTSGQWASARATTLNSGTNWSVTDGGEVGMYRLEFGNGTYMGLGVTNQTSTTSTTGVYSTRQSGAKFTSPSGVTLRVIGVLLNFFDTGTPTANPRARIYNDETLLATSLDIPKENRQDNSSAWFYFPLEETLEIEPSTVLRVVLSEKSNSDASGNRYDYDHFTVENVAATLAIKPFGGTLQQTYYDGSSWTDVDTSIVPFGLVLDPEEPFKETEVEDDG